MYVCIHTSGQVCRSISLKETYTKTYTNIRLYIHTCGHSNRDFLTYIECACGSFVSYFFSPSPLFGFCPFLSSSSDECCTVSAKVRHYGQRPRSTCAVAKSGNQVKPTCAGTESAKFSIPMFRAHCGRRLRNCWGSSANHHIQLIRPFRCSDQKQSSATMVGNVCGGIDKVNVVVY